MATKKTTTSGASKPVKTATPRPTSRPAPAKRIPVQAVTHSKTMANGQARPKRRSK